jgi:cation:H+ antiporter
MTLLLPIFAIIVSLALLAFSADKFVEGASAIAYQFGLSPLLIGLTIVSFGTSAPEILIGVMSALSDNSALAIGNAIGSNIANIALILGFSSLLIPLPVSSTVLRREIPLLLCVVLFSTALLLDLKLTRGDGLAYIGVLMLCLGWLIWQGKKEPNDMLANEFSEQMSAPEPMWKLAAITITALVVLLVSSRTLVWGAIEIARAANVSELMIGLSIVAVGTSLPELAATIASIIRREFGMAIGGVVGSNLFNALAVIGVVALIGPGDIDAMVRNRDALVHIGLTICLLVFCVAWKGHGGRINRLEGLALLVVFVSYQWLLFLQESN